MTTQKKKTKKYTKYHPELVKKAQKMWKEGFSVRVIMAELGFETESTVYYHCDGKRKESQFLHNEKWRKEHPIEAAAISKRATDKYHQKNKEAIKEKYRLAWIKLKNSPEYEEYKKERARKERIRYHKNK